MTSIIEKYFPQLSNEQITQLEKLDALYREWNAQINVISRKDIDNLYTHHVLHSLSIGLTIKFRDNTHVLDFGTGGGFPGIPLAILFPKCKFHLIDGTGKKIKVATEVIQSIGLDNCTATHRRGEEENGKYDFVVSRAVMPLPNLIKIVRKNIANESRNTLQNGVICLKGGDISEEIKAYKNIAEITPLEWLIDDEWFIGKYCIHVPLK